MQRIGDIASMVQGFGKVSKSMVQLVCEDANCFLKSSSVASSIVNKFETVSHKFAFNQMFIKLSMS